MTEPPNDGSSISIVVPVKNVMGTVSDLLDSLMKLDYNKENIREAIIRLRDNPKLCEELGRNAFKAAKDRYNWENEKKNLLKVYKEII